MAKKVVATLKQPGGAKFAKIIRSIKTASGAYAFKEERVAESDIKKALTK